MGKGYQIRVPSGPPSMARFCAKKPTSCASTPEVELAIVWVLGGGFGVLGFRVCVPHRVLHGFRVLRGSTRRFRVRAPYGVL